jgi:hypothetical protein
MRGFIDVDQFIFGHLVEAGRRRVRVKAHGTLENVSRPT